MFNSLIMSPDPVRLAIPGVVWGKYPQADERRHQSSVRRALNMDPVKVAKMVFAAQPTASDLHNVRLVLASDGICDSSCATAISHIVQLVDQCLGLKVRECQIIAAVALINQRVVEMDTGEGKSLVVAIAACIAALCGAPVHVMTTNDYLAQRDANEFSCIFDQLGLTVGAVVEGSPPDVHSFAYAADICYGTAKTFAFDYLRDQQVISQRPVGFNAFPRTSLRGLCFAIVDEIDSVLLDEASMPLVLAHEISDPGSKARLWQALDLASRLHIGRHFTLETNSRRAKLSDKGELEVAELASDYSNEWLNERYRQDLVTQALVALHLMQRDVDYITVDESIVVVDVNTGRAVAGRQFPGELHSLIAVKEHLPPAASTQTSTGLTYPRFFARYHSLSGLSGTVISARREFKSLYGLRSYRVTRHQPNRANRLPTLVYKNRDTQFDSAVRRAVKIAKTGRPVLIGTDSVLDTKLLSQRFSAVYPVTTLTAQCDQHEAQVIAHSGRSGVITISTQIAGRGTDIVPDERSLASGGLHVLNLQHNRSARTDRQMSGRAARQGSPGSHEHWIRLDDSALSPNRLPPWLFAVLRLCTFARLPGLGVNLVQQYFKVEDRLTRINRLQADRKWSNRLHFSSMGDL